MHNYIAFTSMPKIQPFLKFSFFIPQGTLGLLCEKHFKKPLFLAIEVGNSIPKLHFF